MYKRHSTQISFFEEPEMFGNLPLNPKNEWVRKAKLIPWAEFETRYETRFKSSRGQPACSARMALGALIIKERYQFSDEDTVAEIAMNPYLQFFLGLHEYRYEAPFSASMLTRFRQRITPEMLDWVNDRLIGRRSVDDDHDRDGGGDGFEETAVKQEATAAVTAEAAPNEGTMILDATCVPQNIRFPTDASLLNEARENAEEIIDILHEAGLTDGRKPRTYRKKAKKEYNSFSKSRKKSAKAIRRIQKKMLNYLKRDLTAILKIGDTHPRCLAKTLPAAKLERLAAIIVLYQQQNEMYQSKTRRVDDRIVSLAQHWVRPIVRGKQAADVEFGAKAEMSVVNGYLRVEDMRWDAFNEGTTLKDSAEAYRKAYGCYPERILADKIFHTRDNLQFCKTCGIHLNGPKLGRRPADPAEYKRQLKEEWLESGERGEIERSFGVGKRRYSLGCLATRLRHTSEVAVRVAVLTMNLHRKLRLLFVLFCGRVQMFVSLLFYDTALCRSSKLAG